VNCFLHRMGKIFACRFSLLSLTFFLRTGEISFGRLSAFCFQQFMLFYIVVYFAKIP
jgi:hypothetical protein